MLREQELSQTQEFNPFSAAEERRQYDRVSAWLNPDDTLNVLDNEMYLARINPDGSNRADLPNLENVHDHNDDLYENMSLSELCRISVEAELNDDRTTLTNVDEYILDKIDAMGLDDDLVEWDGTSREKSELDLVYDRVTKLRDNVMRSEQLKRAQTSSTPNETIDRLNDSQKDTLINGWEATSGVKLVWNGKREEQAGVEDSTSVIKTPVNESEREEKQSIALPAAGETGNGNGGEVVPATPPEIVDDEDEEVVEIVDGEEDGAGVVAVPAGEDQWALTLEEREAQEAEAEMIEKKRKWPRRVAAGLLGLLGIGAAIGIYNEHKNDDLEKFVRDNAEQVEESVGEDASGVDIAGAAEGLENTTSTEEIGDDESANSEEITASDEQLAELNTAINERTVEIAETEGGTSWDRAVALYGEDAAGQRLVDAVAELQSEGVDIAWTSDPYTTKTANILLDGVVVGPDQIWGQYLAHTLAGQDFERFFAAQTSSTLPGTK